MSQTVCSVLEFWETDMKDTDKQHPGHTQEQKNGQQVLLKQREAKTKYLCLRSGNNGLLGQSTKY